MMTRNNAVVAMYKPRMKSKTLAVTFLSATAFAVGCNKEGTTSQQLDKVQVRKAYQSSKDGFQQARQWVSDKIAPRGGGSMNN